MDQLQALSFELFYSMSPAEWSALVESRSNRQRIATIRAVREATGCEYSLARDWFLLYPGNTVPKKIRKTARHRR